MPGSTRPRGGPGRPAVDPKILMGLWIYATVEGVGNAREQVELLKAELDEDPTTETRRQEAARRSGVRARMASRTGSGRSRAPRRRIRTRR